MTGWLVLVLVGVLLVVVGIGGTGQVLIWLGVALLVAGVVMAAVSRGRGRSRV